MPLFQLSTNLSRADFPQHFHEDLTLILGKLLNKNPRVSKLPSEILPTNVCSELDLSQHILVCICTDQFLTCGGTTEACAFGNLASIGNFAGKDNDAYVQVVSEFIHEKLGIQDSRFTLFLSDYPSNEVGFHGMTIDSFRRKSQTAPAA
ncbi:uncharacterized protein LOC129594818 [Paramacrobiotus metropolitanus]|uniref:uncharacterized protein LOC129594818 n=1 Tax=Paramacrobiotus metropolitanus TaxID=2943436 RepID=UPI0024462949|nr:uncharacterized protein LOC129594818 [Paramacrobiotus metropolitanus]